MEHPSTPITLAYCDAVNLAIAAHEEAVRADNEKLVISLSLAEDEVERIDILKNFDERVAPARDIYNLSILRANEDREVATRASQVEIDAYEATVKGEEEASALAAAALKEKMDAGSASTAEIQDALSFLLSPRVDVAVVETVASEKSSGLLSRISSALGLGHD